jgi:hypothetical protein
VNHEQAEESAVDGNAAAAERGVESVEKRLGVGQPPAFRLDPIGDAMLLFFRNSRHGLK